MPFPRIHLRPLLLTAILLASASLYACSFGVVDEPFDSVSDSIDDYDSTDIPSYVDSVVDSITTVDSNYVVTSYEENLDSNISEADKIENNDLSLIEYDDTIPAPDFLNEEQQILYRKANNVYSHLFSCSTDYVEYYETLDYQIEEYDRFECKTGGYYLISQGRYQNWNDFMTLVLSVFTEDFFNSKNRNIRFIEHNEKLAFLDAARGGCQFYNDNFEDEFELISKSDTEIVFNVIGHYSQIHPRIGESYEERDKRLIEGWETTDKFTIRMVMTESGWRFDEYHDAGIDERTDIFIDDLGWH